MKTAENPVQVEQLFEASVAEVWEAITELAKMKLWYFGSLPSFVPTVGFETEFLITNEGRNFTHQWKITEVVPLQKITYEWRFKEYPDILGTVSFEIFEKENGTLLRVRNFGIDTFPKDVPEFTRASCQDGWEYFINQNLKVYLDG